MIRTDQVDCYCWKPRVVKLGVGVDLLKYYVIDKRPSWSWSFFSSQLEVFVFFWPTFNSRKPRSKIGGNLRECDEEARWWGFVVVFVAWSIGDATTPYVRILPSPLFLSFWMYDFSLLQPHLLDPASMNDQRTSWSTTNFSTLDGSMKTRRLWSAIRNDSLGCQEFLCF